VVLATVAASFGQGGGPVVNSAGVQEHHEAPVGWSRRGHGYVCGCMCTQMPETTLAYALTVWSAMASMAESGGEQRENRGSPLVLESIG
jgi:hypothetical protein